MKQPYTSDCNVYGDEARRRVIIGATQFGRLQRGNMSSILIDIGLTCE